MQSVIWDWNGTLLNDLELCISSINHLLEKRGLKPLDSQKYREVFSFPVRDYYEAIGFDFNTENFSAPAGEFIELYNSKVDDCALHQKAKEILGDIEKLGKKQFVLSAMKQDMLEKTLKHQEILDFFESVNGLDDHYAVSKIELGQQMIDRHQIKKESAVIIGDTIHDFEVAQELRIRCILIANGHQSKERLETTGTVVLPDLGELLNHEWIIG